MAGITKILFRNFHHDVSVLESSRNLTFVAKRFSSGNSPTGENEEEIPEFRVLQVRPPKRVVEEKQKRWKLAIPPPRSEKMATDQDWTAVWPGPRSFHPATVPLPLRQGYNPRGPPPNKYGNAELMKIPNFLHLTPPAITKHCEALKKLCTPWPEGLDTEEAMDRHFPVNIITSDYCHSSPTIRDPLARIVSLKVKVSALELDEHARDKLLRLVGKRYNPDTDVITITTDSCPLRKQNYDYAQYLLTALYHEAWTTEDWEREKSLADMEKYEWTHRPSRQSVAELFAFNQRQVPDTEPFARSVERLWNDGENESNLRGYKEAALDLLGMQPFEEGGDRVEQQRLRDRAVTE